jgi:hypothetical protein
VGNVHSFGTLESVKEEKVSSKERDTFNEGLSQTSNRVISAKLLTTFFNIQPYSQFPGIFEVEINAIRTVEYLHYRGHQLWTND